MEHLVNILERLNQWHWFSLAAILVILEIALGVNFFLLWLGFSAASVAIIVIFFPQISWEYQFLIFAVEAIACIAFWHMHLKHNPTISDEPRLNRRSEQYIGRVITLTEPIVNGRGKIHIDDSFWRVEGQDLPAGVAVKIVDVNGVILK